MYSLNMLISLVFTFFNRNASLNITTMFKAKGNSHIHPMITGNTISYKFTFHELNIEYSSICFQKHCSISLLSNFVSFLLITYK